MVKSIINIGKTCKNQGIKYILISSILVKQSIKLGKIIVQVNEFLLSLSKENGFYFVPHQGITRKHISHDSVHLSSDGSHMFANNLFDFINYFIFIQMLLTLLIEIRRYVMKVWTQKVIHQIKNII